MNCEVVNIFTMPTKRCAWGTCNSDTRYKYKPYMEDVTFYPFPKPTVDLDRCRLWIKQCARPHTELSVDKIKKHHYVCSKHFPESALDPISATDSKSKTPKYRTPKKRESLPPTTDSKKRRVETFIASPVRNSEESSEIIPDIASCSFDDISDSIISINDCKNESSEEKPGYSKKYVSFLDKVTESDKECFYYVGIPSLQLLHYLFDWLKPVAKKTKLWDGKRRSLPGRKGGKTRNKLFQEFVLTLVKIRRGYSNKHLSYLFSISESHVCRIFLAWVNLLSQCLSGLIIWPSKNVVKDNLPKTFSQYPRTRTIIDCTEYFIEKPIRPAAQKATWSNYKHSNTLKQLIGITPCGSICFLSDIYSGSISDVAIVKESKFIDLVEEGDDIMADRGFNIRHLLLPKKATLNIPAFTHGKVLSSKAVKRSRAIAKVRIHVERAIRRMKTFKILSGTIPLKFRFVLHQITKIVAVLCNFQPCLAE